MDRIQETFEWTDLEELLQEDRYLVLNYTPAELAVAASDERRVWEDSMDMARAAADHAEAAQHIQTQWTARTLLIFNNPLLKDRIRLTERYLSFFNSKRVTNAFVTLTASHG